MNPQRSVLLAGFLISGSLGLSFVHPWGDLRQVPHGDELLSGRNVPPDVRETFEKKCADCHSNRTHWPLYSRLAPGSWVMERDVYEGRAVFNISEWNAMRPEKQISVLTRIAAETRSGEMPPRVYLLMHPANHLSEAEKQSVATWAKGERKRLRTRGEEQQKGTEAP